MSGWDASDIGDEGPDDRTVAEAADVLYAAEPEQFMALRGELSAEAKGSGAASAAKRIKALRKPTLAASIVNRFVLAVPSTVEDILGLGARMRAAQDALDAPLLRDLSAERRALVGTLAADALTRSGTSDPSTAVRDEITSTFDAAVADSDIATRLGRLSRSQSWSGFGFGTDTAPELTLVRGGKDATRRPPPEPASRPAATVPAATRRRLARALDKARSAFESADASLASAEASEQVEVDRVRTLSAELAELQGELDGAKTALERARREAKSARTRRREARSALDRAQRQADG